jgi:hypothetical protein
VDRRGAELDYLKYNGREYFIALSQELSTDKQSWENFYSMHPRYKSLVESKFRTFFFIINIWRGKNIQTANTSYV